MGRNLAVLKLVGTPQSMLVERFQIMWPDGGVSDLQVRPRSWFGSPYQRARVGFYSA